MITSGGKDKIWPSAVMADKIMNRLDEKGFSYEKKHLHFAEAGHLVFARTEDIKKFESQLDFFGGKLQAILSRTKAKC